MYRIPIQLQVKKDQKCMCKHLSNVMANVNVCGDVHPDKQKYMVFQSICILFF